MTRRRRLSRVAVRAAAAALCLALWAAGTPAQVYSPVGEYWQQKVDYDIEVELDPAGHMLTGSETITYRNNSPDTLSRFYLHLYPNAYREKTSQLIRDYMQGTLYFFVGLPESWRGWMDVTSLKVGGSDIDFTVDGTILGAHLPGKLPPGGEISIEVAFIERIRPVLGRAGYLGNHYSMAQWYPKMVVYDREGWHPDQFRIGEFYGEFGDFEVSITLPEGFVVAATGVLAEGDPGWAKNPFTAAGPGGRKSSGHPGGHPGQIPNRDHMDRDRTLPKKTVRFRAENVHDFAWAADPSFVVQDTTCNGVTVMSIFRPWNRSWADSALARTVRSLEWLEYIAGPYPYPQVTVVDCPLHGGMEYPMLAMNGSADEGLILHEVGHNYFYGALANNERTEAWLDEGLTQFQTLWYYETKYGPYGKPDEGDDRRTIWEGLSVPIIDLHRTGFAERIATPVHEFQNGFHTMPYVKAPLFINAIRYVVGDEVMREILRTFVDRWKYKHVDEAAFLDVCEEVSSVEMREIFKQWLHTTKNCDYALEDFRVEPEGEQYRATVKIERKGEFMMPLTLAFRLANGNTEPKRVDGMYRTIEESFLFGSKPRAVAINPNNEILDIQLRDNFSPRRRSFAIDNVFDDYRPPDAYQYRFLPIGYYNDIDGGKAGLRMRSAYESRYKQLTLQGLYGFESEAIDYYGSFAHPLRYLGRDAWIRMEGFYREGRQGGLLAIDKTSRESLYDPLAKRFSFYASYHELTDTAYVFPGTYETGSNTKAGISFGISPTTDLFAASIDMTGEASLWWNDFDYQKFFLDARIMPARRYPLPLKPYVRIFFGHGSVDPPLQEMYNLAGAGPLEKERYFWLRSVGAWPEDHYGNFHVPGDANLRGYYEGDFSFKKIFAVNTELELPFPLPVGRKLRRTLDQRLYLFWDAGQAAGKRRTQFIPEDVLEGIDPTTFDGFIWDFGVGINIWKLTAEFPVYLSNPEVSGEQDRWDFRWAVGIHRLF
jgi:hypothetical protein